MTKTQLTTQFTLPQVIGISFITVFIAFPAQAKNLENGQKQVQSVSVTHRADETNETDEQTSFDIPVLKNSTENGELVGQVTSVNQLSDVQPTDWAFQALQSLVERYGAIAGYPDGIYRGNRAITRYEFAAGLNAALDRINELIAAGLADAATGEDLETIQRLQEEFASELAVLRGRVDTLEAQTATVEANQFSTTTRLAGQAIFAVNAGGFEGENLLSPSGAIFRQQDPNATFIYRVNLDLNTSFTGTDLLRVRIDTGSGGPNDNAGGFLEPNFGSTLDFSAKPPSNGNFGLGRLYYTFSPLEHVAVSIGPNIRTTDYIDRNSYANLSFRDFSTLALTNNYVLFPVNGPSAGAAIDWNVGDSPFTIRALYAAADAGNPTDQGILRGTAPFTSLLYPGNTSATADRGDRGFFGDTHQGMVELEYAPSSTLALRVQYSGGRIFDQSFDAVGVNAEVAIAPWLALFGRYGYSQYRDTAFGEIEPNYWMVGIAFPDLLQEGNLAGLAIGQPFIATEIGNATQTNLEAFYRFAISDNIQITPVIQVVNDPANRSENGTVVTGTVRTTFSF
ncbi:carbohydrate porin [Leptolyngbya sp. FACHB-671]|uniref:iron uptake porin n=1 Tax=Leptolyngbya sp. FACHB-671 TaxID=2692812 RepID=UPI0016843D03|nr:iron uptake porin [Leptolyngbya sp. FACHB-671]MBD2069676.1 carbohydrate porin [Leptolyngbya sp. FACHB-671]